MGGNCHGVCPEAVAPPSGSTSMLLPPLGRSLHCSMHGENAFLTPFAGPRMLPTTLLGNSQWRTSTIRCAFDSVYDQPFRRRGAARYTPCRCSALSCTRLRCLRCACTHECRTKSTNSPLPRTVEVNARHIWASNSPRSRERSQSAQRPSGTSARGGPQQ